VQFYSHQTAGAQANALHASATYDGVGLITHQTASTLPNDTNLQDAIDASQTNSSPLAATFRRP